MLRLQSLDAGIGRLEFGLAAFFLLLIVLATGAGVISRYVFDSPIVWAPELSLVSQIWLTFIGASAVYKERGHIGMSGVVQALPKVPARIVQALVDLAIAVLLVLVAVATARIMSAQHTQMLSTLGVPRSVGSAPVVWAMASVTFSILVELFAGPREPGDHEQERTTRP